MQWSDDLECGPNAAAGAEARYRAGDPDRWCRRFGSICVLTACTPYRRTNANCDRRRTRPVGGSAGSALGSDLTDLYANVADAAPQGANCGDRAIRTCLRPPPPIRLTLISQLTRLRMPSMAPSQQAVAVTQAHGVDIVYVDVAGTLGFCGTRHWRPGSFHQRPPPIQDAFHPNAAGYRLCRCHLSRTAKRMAKTDKRSWS